MVPFFTPFPGQPAKAGAGYIQECRVIRHLTGKRRIPLFLFALLFSMVSKKVCGKEQKIEKRSVAALIRKERRK